MEVIKTDIEGVLIIEPRLFRDARGYFFESFSEREFKEKVEPLVGYKVEFCQDNESMSSYGVMRGLHFQRPPFTQSKLVRCVKGRVLDVAVDIRKGSPTYGKHVAVELTEDNHRQFFIPKGFAHGFAVLSETAVFQYKCDNFYHPEADGGISILDESLGIDWRIPTEHANLSEKDTKHEVLKDFDSPFEYYKDFDFKNHLIFFLKSSRPSLLIKRVALGNLKASFHCTYWHRFFPIKEGSTFLTKPLSCPKKEVVTALRCSEPLLYKRWRGIKALALLCGMGPPGVRLMVR